MIWINQLDDPTEKFNQASQMPCLIRDLEKQLNDYRKIVVEPQIKEPITEYVDERADPRKTNDQFWPGWC